MLICSAYTPFGALLIVIFFPSRIVDETTFFTSLMSIKSYFVDVNKKLLHFKFVSLGIDWNKSRVDFRCKLLGILNRGM